jgi:hypothetical protein
MMAQLWRGVQLALRAGLPCQSGNADDILI